MAVNLACLNALKSDGFLTNSEYEEARQRFLIEETHASMTEQTMGAAEGKPKHGSGGRNVATSTSAPKDAPSFPLVAVVAPMAPVKLAPLAGIPAQTSHAPVKLAPLAGIPAQTSHVHGAQTRHRGESPAFDPPVLEGVIRAPAADISRQDVNQLADQLSDLRATVERMEAYETEAWERRLSLARVTLSVFYHFLDVFSDVALIYEYYTHGLYYAVITLVGMVVVTVAYQLGWEILFVRRVEPILILASLLQFRIIIEWFHYYNEWNTDWRKADFRGGVRVFEALMEASVSPIVQGAVLLASREVTLLRMVSLITSAGSALMVTETMIPIMKGVGSKGAFGSVEALFAFSTVYHMLLSWVIFAQFFSGSAARGLPVAATMFGASAVVGIGHVLAAVFVVKDENFVKALDTWPKRLHLATSFSWFQVYPMPICNGHTSLTANMIPFKGHVILAIKSYVQIAVLFLWLVVAHDTLFFVSWRTFLVLGVLALATLAVVSVATVFHMHRFLVQELARRAREPLAVPAQDVQESDGFVSNSTSDSV